ncbi:MAG: hypothetical protein EOO94_02235 [Pedobacter sp.]|nr:MAG: hypothetical protein EOO94_02235 [Pedobacter sp.]
MGKYKKGILGYFRGKVGTVVGSIWKGINYMKSLPDVSNSEPTPAQLNARLKFAMVVSFFSRIKGAINIGYQKFNKGITPMNAATSYHLRSAVIGVSPYYTLDFDKVIISVGDLEDVIDLGATNAESGELVITWKANGQMAYGSPTDMVSIIAYSESLFKFNQVLNVVPRSALTYTMSFPAEFLDKSVRIYLVLTSTDGKECSTSQTLQPVIIM